MNENNSSDNQQYTGKDANDNANQKKNQYVQNEGNENPTNKNISSANAGLGKGTGLSNEANSSQSEELWQGTSGSMANEAQRKNMNQQDGNAGNNNNSFNNTVSNKKPADAINNNGSNR